MISHFMNTSAISAVVVMRILTSKAQHEGRVRAIVNMRMTTTAEMAVNTYKTFYFSLESHRRSTSNSSAIFCNNSFSGTS